MHNNFEPKKDYPYTLRGVVAELVAADDHFRCMRETTDWGDKGRDDAAGRLMEKERELINLLKGWYRGCL